MNAKASRAPRAMAGAGVPVRHMQFDFDPSTMAKYCWKDDAFSSAFILTFSALIPHGERLVIDSVRARRDEVRDPDLKARVTGLIGQEAMHSKVHEAFNEAYRAKGLPIDRVERAGEWFFTRLLPRVLDRDMQLAVTCAIEHVTALMAERSFEEPEGREMLDRAAHDFLLWHLLEECEHKSVAFDLYEEVCGDLWKRRAGMVLILASSSVVFAWALAQFLATPGFSQGLRKDAQGLAYWFGSRGYFARMQRGMRRFYRRDFHPDQTDTEAALRQWREELFGAQGQLSANLLKTILPKRATA